MAKSLEKILDWKQLTGVIQDTRGGVPSEWLPPAFLTMTKPVASDSASYTKISSSRKTARLVHRGSPSKARSLSGVSEVPVKLAHFFEHVIHRSELYAALRNYDRPDIQAQGQAEIDRKTREFKQIFDNTRLSMIASIFRYGKIYFDVDGDLLHSSSNAITTMDFKVPANNKNQLNGIIATKWPTTTADIIGQIKNLKATALKTSGYPIKHAFYGSSILKWLMLNDAIKNYIAGNPAYGQAFTNLEIPPGFLGLTWHPIETAFFEDADGTNRTWFQDEDVIFTPDPSADWWEMLEGSFVVPTSVGNVGSDASAMLGDVKTVHGKFSYALLTQEPVGIKHLMGDTCLPVLKVPSAIYIADVDF